MDGREYRALNLSPREWNRIEDARRKAERKNGITFNNKQFLLYLVGEAE